MLVTFVKSVVCSFGITIGTLSAVLVVLVCLAIAGACYTKIVKRKK